MGIFTCDPRVVTDAKKLDEVAYDELLEMASAGSKIMQSRAVEFAKKFGIEFEVRSSFKPSTGTVAREATPQHGGSRHSWHQSRSPPGKTHNRRSARRTGLRWPDFLEYFRRAHHRGYDRAKRVDRRNDRYFIHNSRRRIGERPENPDCQSSAKLARKRLNTASGVAKLSVVGIGMRSHSGVAARMFECLGRGGINIQLVSTSEIKIAVIIDEKDAERAAPANTR